MSARRAERPYLCQSSTRRADIIFRFFFQFFFFFSATDLAVKELLLPLHWSFLITWQVACAALFMFLTVDIDLVSCQITITQHWIYFLVLMTWRWPLPEQEGS